MLIALNVTPSYLLDKQKNIDSVKNYDYTIIKELFIWISLRRKGILLISK